MNVDKTNVKSGTVSISMYLMISIIVGCLDKWKQIPSQLTLHVKVENQCLPKSTEKNTSF